MGFNINKVGRTEITLCGEFPKEVATGLFEKVTKNRLASMEYEYDPEADKTTLKLFPCVIQNVESEVTINGKTDVCHERRLVLIGEIPAFVDIVESYWCPIRSKAKRSKKDLRLIVMYPPKLVSTPFGENATELGFIADGRCDNVVSALDEAATAMRDKLQLICKDMNPALMSSAHLLDEISMDMADEIHKLEDDATAERLAKMGLRKFDTDDMIFGGAKTVPSAR